MFGLTLIREQDLQFYLNVIKELRRDLIAERERTHSEKIRSDRMIDNLMTVLNQLPVSDEAIGRIRKDSEKKNDLGGLLAGLDELLPDETGDPEDYKDPEAEETAEVESSSPTEGE